MAIKELDKLINCMNPQLVKRNLVFCTINNDIDIRVIPIMIFREKEGTTLILEKDQADEYNLEYDSIWDMITLCVNSDLEAVGFLPQITSELAKNNICVNAVSAYYHDHLFVPHSKSEESLKILKKFRINKL